MTPTIILCRCELARKEAKPEAPVIVQSHDAAGVVAGTLLAAFEVHRKREIERVADAGPDDIADE